MAFTEIDNRCAVRRRDFVAVICGRFRSVLAVASAVSADWVLATGERCAEDSAHYSNLAVCEFVSVAIGNRKSKIENLLAGVVQW